MTHSRLAELKEMLESQQCEEGIPEKRSANTMIELPPDGRLISGVSSTGINEVQLPPSRPAGTAMY